MTRLRLVAALLVVAAFGGACFGGGSGERKVVAYFDDVGDLVARSSVQYNDVKIGTVNEIELTLDDGNMLARVTMTLGEDVSIPATDLGAAVRQTSLLGEQFIELVPGSSGAPYVSAAKPVTIPVERTTRKVDVETFLGDLAGFLGGGGFEDLNRFTHVQALILQDRGDRLGKALEELEQFTGVLASREFDIRSAIDNLAGASKTLADNRGTIDSFLDSLDDANILLADEGDDLIRLFRSLRGFGTVNARFLARHEDAIRRGFKALRPVLDGLAGAQGALRADLSQLSRFFELFPKSLGGGPGGGGKGDYVQAQAILCESLAKCHTKGEKGDVPHEGSDR
jgi:phospholipid/cholesterol/gamma-HCH transport system substrate-binding protein